MPETADIGARLREIRKRRGMTQSDLADAAELSVSLVRKVEQGEKPSMRLETVHRFARALDVPTTRLLEAGADCQRSASANPDDQWAPVRTVLADSSRPGEAPTLRGVRGMVEAAVALYPSGRFSDLAAVLPRLIRDSRALAQDVPDGRAVYARLLQLTASSLVMYRSFDAAREALAQGSAATDTPHQAAALANVECWLLLRRGRLAESQRVAERWADETEPRMSRASALELATWGRMLLRVSAAAVRDNRKGDAEDALRLALSSAIAVRPGALHDPELQVFDAAMVQRKRAEAASVADRPDRVLELTDTIPGARTNGHRRHLLDVAHAQVATRRHAEAFETLWGIWESAPEWLPQQVYAKRILRDVIERRRTLAPDMRALADAMHMPL